MIDKTIRSGRKVGGDYFRLIYSRRSKNKLDYYLPLFNFDDYWCFKSSRKQRLISYDEFIEFKYSGYTFFRKDLYDLNHIQYWINWMNSFGGIQFLSIPLPPFIPQKIIIKK